MIAIRADANAKIGTGHMMRCFAIARELVQQGEDVMFLTADTEPERLIYEAGFKQISLHTDWKRLEDEIPKINTVLKTIHAKGLLVDHYGVSEQYFQKLDCLVSTACLDDFGTSAYPVDLLINYNISTDLTDYEQLYEGYPTIKLLGPCYAPLRQEFQKRTLPPIREQIANILMTTGGTDPFGISALLAKEILQSETWKSCKLYLIVGRYYENQMELSKLAKAYPNLILCEQVCAMSKWMLQCDVAISASGMTVYELCACGLPAVIVSFVDNQLQIRECFGRKGVMMDAGDIRTQTDKGIKAMLQGLDTVKTQEKRRELRRKMLQITDGQGAYRIANQLLQFRLE